MEEPPRWPDITQKEIPFQENYKNQHSDRWHEKLEQIRLMGKVEIKVGYCDSNPLSIDTLEDLQY